tara:strand:- start:14388 stop:14675 length:288 start_codon:yes stop_codon:yes gene_type:complete
MICADCVEDIYSNGIVEWLSTAKGIALADTLRIVHADCQYYKTDFDKMHEHNYFDHWLPLDQLVLYVDIALEMHWDNLEIMQKKINRFIKKRGNT